MSTRSFLYGLWCLGIAGAFLAATVHAWSPFAEGRRARPGVGGVGGVYVGPRHK